MRRTLVVDCAGLGPDLLDAMPALQALAGRGACLPLEPVLPATTCPVQATLLTGRPPAVHGIVANGLYFHDTAEVRFWEQSAHLVAAPRVWEDSGGGARVRVAHLFWQLGMYSSAEVLLTPKPIHAPGDRLIQDCYSRPMDLYTRLAAGESSLALGAPRGPFDLTRYWGPRAGLGSSRWIADAALAVWRDERPELALVYLPHLDYTGHRDGPTSAAHRAAAGELDGLLGPLVEAAEADRARVVVLGDYSFLEVSRPVAPNRVLREAGLLAPREVEGAEYLYPGDCRAFALVDNQVAHVYFPRPEGLEADVRRARRALEAADGVGEVLDRAAAAERGLDHVRSGELVLVAEPDAHFVYYWWTDDARAPPFARTVDIHAKPGFDAAELLVDPATRAIPVEASRVRGSHGLLGPEGEGWGLVVATDPPASLADRTSLRADEAAHLLVADGA